MNDQITGLSKESELLPERISDLFCVFPVSFEMRKWTPTNFQQRGDIFQNISEKLPMLLLWIALTNIKKIETSKEL